MERGPCTGSFETTRGWCSLRRLASGRRRFGLCYGAVSALAAMLVLYAPVAAASSSARLVYLRSPGAEGCPDEADLRRAVATRLGYDPFFAVADTTLVVEIGRTSRTEERYHATIKLLEGDSTVRGTRELDLSGACSTTVDTLALSMSIAIDPSSLLGPTEPAPPDPPPAPAPPEPAPASKGLEPAPREPRVARPAPSRDSAKPTPIRVGAALRPFLSVGSAPAVNTGGALDVWLRRGALALTVSGRVDASASTDVPAGTIATSMLLGEIAAVAHLDPVYVGLVTAFGEVRGERLAAESSRDVAFRAALGLRVGLAVPLVGPLSARAQVDAMVSLTDHALVIDGAPAFTLSRVYVTPALALAVEVPFL